MTTDQNDHDSEQNEPDARPNASPELQDAIRSIDAIGENAWGKDDDEDASRGREDAETDPSLQDRSLQDSQDGNPDAP
jgi:hypothetical protein